VIPILGNSIRSFAMTAALALRDDFDGSGLRALAKASGDANQVRRLLALAEIYDGGSRSAAARLGGVGVQSIRDWVLRFNAGGPEALIDAKAGGRPPKLGPAALAALVRVVEDGPIPAVHGVVRWRLVDLRQWVFEEFGIETSVQSLSEQLRALGYRKLSARPRHPRQDLAAQEAFKKTSPPSWQRLPQRLSTIGR
jgi:transposase